MTIQLQINENIINSDICFPEGSRWREGSLYFTDIDGQAVYCIGSDGIKTKLFDMPYPSGLGWLPSGAMIISSMRDQKLYQWHGGELTVYADLSTVAKSYLNDLVTDQKGNVYVGDIGFLYGKDPEQSGNVIKVDQDKNISSVCDQSMFANGILIDEENQRLILVESCAERVAQYDMDSNGNLTNKRDLFKIEKMTPDGIALDSEGALWIADPLGRRAVIRVNQSGEVTHEIPFSGEHYPFDCVLGGEDMKNLYIMSSTANNTQGRVDMVRVPTAGKLM